MFIRRQFTPSAQFAWQSKDSVAIDEVRGTPLRLTLLKDGNFRRVYFMQHNAGGGTTRGRLRFSRSGEVACEIPFRVSSSAPTSTHFTFGNPGFGLLSTAGTGPNTLFLQVPGSASPHQVMPLELSIVADTLELVNEQITGPGTGWTSFLGVLSYITAN